MPARQVVAPWSLVDVVPQVEDEIEILGCHVAIRGEEAGFVMLARRERESQSRDIVFCPGESARPSNAAGRAAGLEAIPVLAVRLQSLHFDVHGVRPLGRRRGVAALHDAAHLVV